jgi:hypothetical protein
MRFKPARSKTLAWLAIAIAATTLPAPIAAQSQQRVQFAKGATGTKIDGTIRGRNYVDYMLNARAGQRLSVSMTSKNTAAYFNLIAPGETDVAFYVGSNSTPLNRFDGIVPSTGDMRVRVYLYRAAARRNEVANYRLAISITGEAKQSGPPGDAMIPGTDYHARGEIPCTVGSGASSRCAFGVHREGGGSGWVQVTRPNGAMRTIFFEQGKAIRFDESEADRAPFSARREGDDTIVRIGDETYVIPDAVIFGG